MNSPKRAKQQLARVGSNRAVRSASMVALSLHLLALTAAYYPVPVVQPPEQYQYYAYEPAPQFLARSGDVQMSTQYQPGVFAAIGRKKDPRTGQTKSLSFFFLSPLGRGSPTARNLSSISLCDLCDSSSLAFNTRGKGRE